MDHLFQVCLNLCGEHDCLRVSTSAWNLDSPCLYPGKLQRNSPLFSNTWVIDTLWSETFYDVDYFFQMREGGSKKKHKSIYTWLVLGLTVWQVWTSYLEDSPGAPHLRGNLTTRSVRTGGPDLDDFPHKFGPSPSLHRVCWLTPKLPQPVHLFLRIWLGWAVWDLFLFFFQGKRVGGGWEEEGTFIGLFESHK